MNAIPFRRILPIAHCALMLVTYSAMIQRQWEGIRAWDRGWIYERTHPQTGPVAFNDPAAIRCSWPYGWKVVIAFNLPAMLATGGTMLNCASEEPVGLRHRIRPLLLVPLMAGMLTFGVWLQWWFIGKWLDRVLPVVRRQGSHNAHFWAAIFLGGPILMGLGYWTPFQTIF